MGRRRVSNKRLRGTKNPPAFRLAAFYAFYFGILGILLPYWPLYLEGEGFGPGAIGALMAALPLTKVISPAFWGWLADRNGRPLRYIRGTSFLSALSMGLLLLHPNDVGQVGLVMVAFGLFWNAPLPLFETVTLAHLRGRGGYGRIRLWGSIGFILSVVAGGRILGELLPVSRLPEVLLALLIGQWIITLLVPSVSISHHSASEETSLSATLRQPGVWGFLIAAFLIQIAHGPYYAFYSVLLSDHGFTDAVIGQLWALGVLAEILLFLSMDRLERRFGVRELFLLAILISVLRWAMIGWGINVLVLIILAQVLHAGTFGLMHSSSIALVHRHFRGVHHSKGQAIYSGFCYGLGGTAGSLFAGYLWQFWPPSGVFAMASMISLAALVVARVSIPGREPSCERENQSIPS